MKIINCFSFIILASFLSFTGCAISNNIHKNINRTVEPEQYPQINIEPGNKLDELDKIVFRHKLIYLDGLSSETLEWLEWYNTLSPDEKNSINSIPSDLYYRMLFSSTIITETEDADY